MKKIVLLALALLLTSQAFAADNAVIVTPGVGVTMKSKDIGAGVQAMQPILSDASGNTLLTTVGADAVSNTLTGIPVYSRQLFFNGTTWDRWQGLVTATLAAETTKVIGTVRVASGGIASGAVASGAFAAGSIASGAMVDLGAQADAAAVADNSTASLIALLKRTNQNLSTVNTSLGSLATHSDAIAATPACSAAPCATTIGNVGIDPISGKATPAFVNLALPATTTTQIIALSGSTKTYITSLKMMASGAVNLTLKYGTGSNCGTGTTTLEGPYPLAAQAGVAIGSGSGAVIIVPAGQATCVTTDASVSGFVSMTSQQF